MAKNIWYDDYLNKNQSSIIKSLEEDAEKITREDLKELLEYEKANDNRMKLIEFINKLLSTKKEDVPMKKNKKDKKGDSEGKVIYIQWTGFTEGITLPDTVGGRSVYKKFPVPISEEALEYLEERYTKKDFKILSESDLNKGVK